GEVSERVGVTDAGSRGSGAGFRLSLDAADGGAVLGAHMADPDYVGGQLRSLGGRAIEAGLETGLFQGIPLRPCDYGRVHRRGAGADADFVGRVSRRRVQGDGGRRGNADLD